MNHRPSNGRLVDFVTQAWNTKRVWMRNDCDGTPTCVAELHVEYLQAEIEVHLTEEECKQLQKALKVAIKEHRKAS